MMLSKFHPVGFICYLCLLITYTHHWQKSVVDAWQFSQTSTRRGFVEKVTATATTATATVLTPLLVPTVASADDPDFLPFINRNGDKFMIPTKIKRASEQQEIDLAEHLSKKGFIFYGAFWCPHCQQMKEAFGREAWSKINYVECSRQAPTGTPDICQEAGVKGYPTFQLGNNSNKQVFSGELALSELASISKYAGTIVDPVMDDGGD